MPNYLIRSGQSYAVKVAIPADVQHIFGKRAFKQSLQTRDKTLAITRSAPLIAEFKDAIAKARGNPTQLLEDYLKDAQNHLRANKADSDTDPDAIAAIEDGVLDKLLSAYNVKQPEDLPKDSEASVIEAYKIATGQETPFAAPIEDYLASRNVEAKTASKERRAINEFADGGITVRKVDRKAVRTYVRRLASEKGLKNKTIRDRLSFLGIYWNWLVYQDFAPEDTPNPFASIELPKENRKNAVEDARLPFEVSDIRKLHKAIQDTDHAMLKAAFMIAIYTGCRIEEIASLERSNISDDAIKIDRDKSASGNREIPVHNAIIPLIQDLNSRGHQFLLPDLTSDQFGGRSFSIGQAFTKVKTELKYDGRYVFHSLRKTVATQLEQAGVPEGIAADILGHQKKTMSYGVYSGGSSMEQKREAVLKLDYGFLG